jgi:fatty acid desaturase
MYAVYIDSNKDGVDLFLYVFMVAGTFVFESAALKVGCSVSAGLVISSLFVIGHDAAHNSYTGSRRLNILISVRP